MDIEIYSEIYPGLENEISKQLKEANEPVNIRICSPGGFVYTGWLIGNLIGSCKQKTTAIIEGYCGSIATYIALKCDRVVMSTGLFMIHNSSISTEGDKNVLQKNRETLLRIDNEMISLYSKKTGLQKDVLQKMMDEELHLNKEEALKYGFIDEIQEDIKAVARFENFKTNEIKMEKQKVKESLSVIERIVSRFVKNSEPKSMAYELENGNSVFIEAEEGEEIAGKKVFLSTEQGEATETPAPDGEHKLKDGKIILVQEGVIQDVLEEEIDQDDIQDKDKVIEELKNEIENLKNKNKEAEEKEKETMQSFNEVLSSMQQLAKEVKSLKSLTVGGEFKADKAQVMPKDKSVKNAEPDNASDFSLLINRIKNK